MTGKKPQILAIVGPTSSGKSDLAVEVALAFDGEVVSADSRQVYSGLDIGTGKITPEEMRGVPHHLLNVADPQRTYTVSEYKEATDRAIGEILRRGKLPILCGGTGFYIQAVADGITFPDVPPDEALREELKGKSTPELFEILKTLDPARAQTIERENPRRLIRSIEIAKTLGHVPELPNTPPPYDTLFIGIAVDDETLKERITRRLEARLAQGMIEEAEHLHAVGLSCARMHELGLEYRFLAEYLQNKLTRVEMISQLATAIWHYARRQHTWFKRDQRIKWFPLEENEKIFETIQIWRSDLQMV